MNVKALALLPLILLMVVAPAFAAAPANVRECDPSSPTYTKTFAWYGYGHVQTLQLANCGGYFDQALMTGKFINFTNISLLSPTNPAHSFAVGSSNSNLTLASMTTKTVSFTSNPTVANFSAGMPKLFYYYRTADGIPGNVTLDGALIPSNLYTNVVASFNSCALPCAYINTANNTLIVRALSTQPILENVCTFPLGSCATSSNVPLPGTGIPLLLVLFVIAFIIFFLMWGHHVRKHIYSLMGGLTGTFTTAWVVTYGVFYTSTWTGTAWVTELIDANLVVVLLVMVTVASFLSVFLDRYD